MVSRPSSPGSPEKSLGGSFDRRPDGFRSPLAAGLCGNGLFLYFGGALCGLITHNTSHTVWGLWQLPRTSPKGPWTAVATGVVVFFGALKDDIQTGPSLVSSLEELIAHEAPYGS